MSFCAKAFATVPVEHPDAAALTILGDFLRNGFLHRAIRERGGAYGSGAGQDSGEAAFRFFSYRDPRLTETLDDFDASIKWLSRARLRVKPNKLTIVVCLVVHLSSDVRFARVYYR